MLLCNGLISTSGAERSIECIPECVISRDSWERDVRMRELINALKSDKHSNHEHSLSDIKTTLLFVVYEEVRDIVHETTIFLLEKRHLK